MPLLPLLLVVLYGLCLVFIICFSMGQWQLTRLARRAYAGPPTPLPPAPSSWPKVTVQLPLYNEQNVVERVIDATAALEYPADRLHIQVLDDSTDATVGLAAARVAHHTARGLHITHVRRPGREGYKAGALRHGLTETDGEYIAIFDADFVPTPDFLRRTMPFFLQDERVGVVQTRWGHLNQDESLLTRLQAFGLDAHFLIEQVGRTFAGFFINFNGTGGVWRRSCIDDAGGWHTDTLTEDLDLSYRAQLRGWRFVYRPEIVAPAELPAVMDALKSQQFRWTKGAAETARKHLGTMWRSSLPLATKLQATFHLLNSSVYVVIMLMALLSVPLVFVRADYREFQLVFQLASVFLLGFVPLIYYYYTAWRLAQPTNKAQLYPGFFLLFLSVSMGLALHNARAVLLGWMGQRTPFVRTPKTGNKGRTKRRYRTGGVGLLVVLEGVLAVYFAFGLGAGIYFGDAGLLPFHTLLTFGFAAVCYYSVRHSQQ
ncbi:cellulose synthase family protein [Hymenobacter arizonensis]|uniref:Glycosyltransferase, catalytic subunit of cellulose synthase and poly-beta-1,6-N-acetylglucosamine synthase n=1 Tax=Hymenobacter arizonensis TaxID=1227077 RepID=A0A1I5TI81_HYMAR|nr:cellulose synthase family protein [Hymenobacter arizonensis]SFP82759.1 Glycosyltransferase, catalytic subunit of cellulose synthase and poly-beta-1,6-N-acetylglucosamine synthase [Hymenobacter arizonensis]